MATRTAKQSSNTPAAKLAGTSKGDSESVLASMQQSFDKAMKEMGRVGNLLATLQAEISDIKETSAGLRTDMDSVMQRLDEAESRISQLEDENVQLRQEASKSTKDCEQLRCAVEDAANRDRRQNLRLIGLKEGLEGNKPSECVRTIISEALGIELDRSELQRVHRVPTVIPDDAEDNLPPRPIVIRFLSFLEKERVLNATKRKYKNKEGVNWKGCQLSFFPDMTRETAAKRKKFKDVKDRLHTLNVRFTVAFPAELRFTWQGKKLKFTDDKKAMNFLDKHTQRQSTEEGSPVHESADE